MTKIGQISIPVGTIPLMDSSCIQNRGFRQDAPVERYFVYVHQDLSTNEVFYVGKGCNTRHAVMSSRGKKHTLRLEECFAKKSLNAAIIYATNDEDKAYRYERIAIRYLREANLRMVTDDKIGAEMNLRYEVEWCSYLPCDENGDADTNKAKYEVCYFTTPKKAVEFAKKLMSENKDAFGSIRVSEEMESILNDGKGWRRRTWDAIRTLFVESKDYDYQESDFERLCVN